MEKSDIIALHERVEKRLAGLLEDIPADKWCYQPFPGANHALWTVGHLAVVNHRFTATLEGRQPEPHGNYQELFGMGTTPVGNPAAYPPVSEVLAFAAQVREAWLAAIKAVSPGRLTEETPEQFRRFAPTWGMMVAGLSQHTAFHMGELAVIRKALGMKPKFA
jgi:hypothetical protein